MRLQQYSTCHQSKPSRYSYLCIFKRQITFSYFANILNVVVTFFILVINCSIYQVYIYIYCPCTKNSMATPLWGILTSNMCLAIPPHVYLVLSPLNPYPCLTPKQRQSGETTILLTSQYVDIQRWPDRSNPNSIRCITKTCALVPLECRDDQVSGAPGERHRGLR